MNLKLFKQLLVVSDVYFPDYESRRCRLHPCV